MIKVFIVDDEMLVRMGLKMMVDWRSKGIDIIGEAANGSEAFEKIKELKPDIIITDIVMPDSDGISLIKEIKRSRFKGRIIVLSNYNEFDYVKEALKNGASEYLLKVTLNEDEVIRVIYSLWEEMLKEREAETVQSEIKIELNENKGIIKERLINGIRTGEFSKKYIENKIAMHGLKISRKNVAVMFFIEDFRYLAEETSIKDEGLLNFSIENIVDEVINRKYRGEVFYLKKDTFVMLLSTGENYDFELSGHCICELCNEIKTLIKRYINLETYFIYQAAPVCVETIGEILNKMILSCERTFFGEDTFLLDINEPFTVSDSIDAEFWKMKGELKEALEVSSESLELVINKILNSISERHYSVSIIKQIFHHLITLLEEMIRNENGDMYKIVDRDIFNYVEHCHSFSRFKMYMLSVYRTAVQYLEELKKTRFRNDVIAAINYIKSNYREKISLDDVAAFINMNKNYFCKLFKEETGQSPVEYIIKYKMEKAQELLKTSGMNVSETARYIGYDDISYFNRLFKKHVGTSPGSYVK